jgi:hypothetical protein
VPAELDRVIVLLYLPAGWQIEVGRMPTRSLLRQRRPFGYHRILRQLFHDVAAALESIERRIILDRSKNDAVRTPVERERLAHVEDVFLRHVEGDVELPAIGRFERGRSGERPAGAAIVLALERRLPLREREDAVDRREGRAPSARAAEAPRVIDRPATSRLCTSLARTGDSTAMAGGTRQAGLAELLERTPCAMRGGLERRSAAVVNASEINAAAPADVAQIC